jgi:hypothetical protein
MALSTMWEQYDLSVVLIKQDRSFRQIAFNALAGAD